MMKEQYLYGELKNIRRKIPVQTYRTIIGQIRAGDVNGAEVGIGRLKVRIAREEAAYANRSR